MDIGLIWHHGGGVAIANSKTEENGNFNFLIPKFYPIVQTSHYFRQFLIYEPRMP